MKSTAYQIYMRDGKAADGSLRRLTRKEYRAILAIRRAITRGRTQVERG